MTWSQVWTMMKNTALMSVQPVLDGVNWLANNIDMIRPIVLGAGAAFGVFQIAANWTTIAATATGIYTAATNFLSIGFGVLTGNTAAASAAVHTLTARIDGISHHMGRGRRSAAYRRSVRRCGGL